jgi:hypothetical protein
MADGGPAVSDAVWRGRRAEDGSGVLRNCRCGRRVFGAGNQRRSRRCPDYGLIWAGDQRQKLFRNLDAVTGAILLGAVTAPGAADLPWAEGAYSRLGHHKHSGRLGCRVDEAKAREWNESAPSRWRRLHRRAYQDTVKRCGSGSVWLVARVWEMQTRGVLHVHPVLAWRPDGSRRDRLRCLRRSCTCRSGSLRRLDARCGCCALRVSSGCCAGCGCRDRSCAWRTSGALWHGLSSLRTRARTVVLLLWRRGWWSEHGRTAAEGRTDVRMGARQRPRPDGRPCRRYRAPAPSPRSPRLLGRSRSPTTAFPLAAAPADR